MPTAGPYRLQRALSSCEVGDVWSGVDERGRSVTVAVLNERAAADDRWRGAFAAAADALGQAGADQLPIVGADHDTGRPWVACAVERGAGAAEIFSVLGLQLRTVPGIVPVPAEPASATGPTPAPDPAPTSPGEEPTLWMPPPPEPATGPGRAVDAGPAASGGRSPWDLPPARPGVAPVTRANGVPASPADSPRGYDGREAADRTEDLSANPAEDFSADHGRDVDADRTEVVPPDRRSWGARAVSPEAVEASPAPRIPAQYFPAPGPYTEPAVPGHPGPYPPVARLDADAPISGASVSGGSVSGASVSGAAISGAAISGAAISGAPVSSASVSGASVSGASDSGASVSGASVSGMPISGDLSYPYRSRVFGDPPPAKPRRTGWLIAAVAVVSLLAGGAAGAAVMAARDRGGTPRPAPTTAAARPTPQQLLLPATAPAAPGVEPPVGGGWPSGWPVFTSQESTRPMNGLPGVGFDFRVPPSWNCAEQEQTDVAVRYRCGAGTGDTATGGDLTVRQCVSPCTDTERTTLRKQEEAWGLQWTRSGPFTVWAETNQLDGRNPYGLVYVAFWRSTPEGPIDRELVLRLSSPRADSDDLKKVANSVRDRTFTL
jgi:hypothetical protein